MHGVFHSHREWNQFGLCAAALKLRSWCGLPPTPPLHLHLHPVPPHSHWASHSRRHPSWIPCAFTATDHSFWNIPLPSHQLHTHLLVLQSSALVTSSKKPLLDSSKKKAIPWDFLHSPVVKNLPCRAGDAVSVPGWGTKIPHAMEELSPWAKTRESVAHSERSTWCCVPQLRRSQRNK